jgi:hypothetical protein
MTEKIHLYAEYLRNRQISKAEQMSQMLGVTKTEYIVAVKHMSDRDIIDSYIKCSDCGEYITPMPEMLELVEGSESAEEAFQAWEERTSHTCQAEDQPVATISPFTSPGDQPIAFVCSYGTEENIEASVIVICDPDTKTVFDTRVFRVIDYFDRNNPSDACTDDMMDYVNAFDVAKVLIQDAVYPVSELECEGCGGLSYYVPWKADA